MQFEEAKIEFLNAWGALGIAWGINKTMAQIFALLFISPNPLSVEQLMDELDISRGNCSMNLRSLMDWGLIYKTTRKGERREFFFTDKDFWLLSKKIAAERAKRELDPLKVVLNQVKEVKPANDPNVERFRAAVKNMGEVVNAFDAMSKLYAMTSKDLFKKNVSALTKGRTASNP